MATIEELVEQYEKDPALRKEIAEILADGKVTMFEFMGFAKRHHVKLTPEELHKYTEQARQMGFIK